MKMSFPLGEVISWSHSTLGLLQEKDRLVGEVGTMNEDRSEMSWKLAMYICPRGGKMLWSETYIAWL